MSNVPADLKYTKSHEWVRTLPDGTLEIGITDHAQHALGDLVFVEVPEAGRTLAAGEPCAVVESVKAASDVYAPLAGEVTAGNAALATQPELVNSDAYGAGWLLRLKPAAGALAAAPLLSAADYQKVAGRGGRLMAFIPHTPRGRGGDARAPSAHAVSRICSMRSRRRCAPSPSRASRRRSTRCRWGVS